MNLKPKNEKAIRQRKTSAVRKAVRSQAPEAQKNRPSKEVAGEATSLAGTQSAKETSTEADNGRGEEIVVDEAQDAVSQFLSKIETKAADYIDIIEDMLGNYSTYGWAESTLVGIYDFIKKNGYITDKQIEAVENIRQSRL